MGNVSFADYSRAIDKPENKTGSNCQPGAPWTPRRNYPFLIVPRAGIYTPEPLKDAMVFDQPLTIVTTDKSDGTLRPRKVK